jgi:tripartite-type tricarboxylate transporter receptor subunit TctC
MKTFAFTRVAGLALAGLLLSAALAGTAFAQTYPAHPVRMIVPFPAGTATDMAARMLGQQLGAVLGQPFVIDNKPGAGGSIGAMEVVRATPDGYTLLFGSNSALSSNVALLKNMPYDPGKDFTPIAGFGETMHALMVKSSFPAKNMQEFISYVKQRPGKVSAGYGSSSAQVGVAMLNKLAGLDLLAVPYKGIPLAVNDVLGGTLDMTSVDLGNAMAQAKGGNMRALGVTSAKRNPLVPDWPAVAETLPGFEITSWFGVVGPARMPPDVVAKLNAAITQTLKLPEVQANLATIGTTPMPMAPDQLKAFIDAEMSRWKRLAKDANIQPE